MHCLLLHEVIMASLFGLFGLLLQNHNIRLKEQLVP